MSQQTDQQIIQQTIERAIEQTIGQTIQSNHQQATYIKSLYESTTAIITTIVVLTLIFIRFYIIPSINTAMVFRPRKTTKKDFDRLAKKYKDHIEYAEFNTEDNLTLTGMLLNNRRKPSWDDDIIFLYSHGNAAWLGDLFTCSPLIMLSKHGSMFMYDYRGYGMNPGTVSEVGCYKDVMAAWYFLTRVKNIDPNKIIVFGHSLGSAVSSKLVSNLVSLNDDLPRGLILEAPFSSVFDMGNHVMPGLGYISVIKFNNEQNLLNINGAIPVLVMHSKDDETIPYEQAMKLKNNTKCDFIEITGTHCDPHYNHKVKEYIDNLVNEN